jgi:UDP-glucose:(heptosyl)LPS alpha-1,3-glucosyltransferase
VLFCDRTWPESAWGDREQIVLKKGKSPADFALALEDRKPKEHCDFLFSLERVWRCDCYRAGDGVHAAWMERRERYEPKWRAALRCLNLKHVQILRLEESLYRPSSDAHIIANAVFIKDEIVETYGTPPERITVIPNGFDPAPMEPDAQARLRQAGRRLLRLSEDAVTFLFVGSGWERKGLRFAIHAVQSLADMGHPVRLLVAGKDKRKPRTRLSGITEFIGPLSATELTQIYESSDVFILPTIYDPFSNACLEAASHGLPVITTETNGFGELKPEFDGDVVPAPDSPELIEACERWLDPELRLAARPKNRAAAQRYNVARNVEDSIALFETLI